MVEYHQESLDGIPSTVKRLQEAVSAVEAERDLRANNHLVWRALNQLGSIESSFWRDLPPPQRATVDSALSEVHARLRALLRFRLAEVEAAAKQKLAEELLEMDPAIAYLSRPPLPGLDYDDFDNGVMTPRDEIERVLRAARSIGLPGAAQMEADVHRADERLRKALETALKDLGRRNELRGFNKDYFDEGYWWRGMQQKTLDTMHIRGTPRHKNIRNE